MDRIQSAPKPLSLEDLQRDLEEMRNQQQQVSTSAPSSYNKYKNPRSSAHYSTYIPSIIEVREVVHYRSHLLSLVRFIHPMDIPFQ